MIQRLCLSSWFDLLLKTLNVIFKIPDVIDILFFLQFCIVCKVSYVTLCYH